MKTCRNRSMRKQLFRALSSIFLLVWSSRGNHFAKYQYQSTWPFMSLHLCVKNRWLFVKRHTTTIHTNPYSTVSISFDNHGGYQAVSISQLMITLLGWQASVLTQPCSIMRPGNSGSFHGVHFCSSGCSGFCWLRATSFGYRRNMRNFTEYSIRVGPLKQARITITHKWSNSQPIVIVLIRVLFLFLFLFNFIFNIISFFLPLFLI